MYFEHKRLYRSLKSEVPDGDSVIELGKARLAREGADATIVTYGGTVPMACEISDELRSEGKASVEVIDLRSLAPLDEEAILSSVRKTNRVLILHEDNLTAGFGAELSARLSEKAFELLDAPIMRLAASDTPVPFAPNLEKVVLPSKDQLKNMMLELLDF
jgi:pyruvate/2-oxoglutarate/acetoin dehydrogenase E1 component